MKSARSRPAVRLFTAWMKFFSKAAFSSLPRIGLLSVAGLAAISGCPVEPGSLTVYLAPQEAVDAGARWYVEEANGGKVAEYFVSGQTVGLPAYEYFRVLFTPVPGYPTPEPTQPFLLHPGELKIMPFRYYDGGACWLSSTECIETTPAACLAMGGVYGGDGTMCPGSPPPQPPLPNPPPSPGEGESAECPELCGEWKILSSTVIECEMWTPDNGGSNCVGIGTVGMPTYLCQNGAQIVFGIEYYCFRGIVEGSALSATACCVPFLSCANCDGLYSTVHAEGEYDIGSHTISINVSGEYRIFDEMVIRLNGSIILGHGDFWDEDHCVYCELLGPACVSALR